MEVCGSGVKLIGRRWEGRGRGSEEIGASLLAEDMVCRERINEDLIQRRLFVARLKQTN